MHKIAQAWEPLVFCNTKLDAAGKYTDPCGYYELIKLAQTVITDLIILATLLATVVFIYAGFKLMTSGGDPGAAKEAKEMLMKVVWGFLWILVAWIVVYTIMNTLLKPEFNTVLGTPR